MDSAYEDYRALIERAQACLDRHDLDGAEAAARAAAGVEPGAPAAFHILGVIREARSRRVDAQRFYRAALALDPEFGPALHQLRRSLQPPSQRTSPLWPPPDLHVAERSEQAPGDGR